MADIKNQDRSQLVITLKDSNGDNHNITISNPKSDVSEAEIKALAEHIVTNQYLTTSVDNDFVSLVKAKVVVYDTDTFDLIV